MPPKTIQIGNGSILATKEDFVNGYQAGHLAYTLAKNLHPAPFTDEYLTNLFIDKLEDMGLTTLYGIGYAVGWLGTLANKGGQA